MVDAAFTGGPEGLAEEPVKALDVAAAVEDMDDEKALVYIKTSLLRMLGKSDNVYSIFSVILMHGYIRESGDEHLTVTEDLSMEEVTRPTRRRRDGLSQLA